MKTPFKLFVYRKRFDIVVSRYQATKKDYMRFLLIIVFCLSNSVYAQSLLANGSFEDENVCSELHSKCSPSAWINISLGDPLMINSFAIDGQAFDGTHFVNVIAGNSKMPNIRSFISTQLLCGLRKGKNYLVEFYTRASFSEIDSIGVYFSSDNFLYEKKSFEDIRPSIWMIKGTKQRETPLQWSKYSFTYLATGEEVFFTLGVFKRNDFSNNNYEGDLSVYFDNVSLTPLDINEKPCTCSDSVKNDLYKDHDRHSQLIRRRLSGLQNQTVITKKIPKTAVLSIDTLTLTGINFETSKSDLTEENVAIIDNFIETIRQKKIDSIIIAGHADSTGNQYDNAKLSEQRAREISNYISLKSPNIASKIIIKCFGDTKPIFSNTTSAGRMKNRRVEIFVYRNKED